MSSRRMARTASTSHDRNHRPNTTAADASGSPPNAKRLPKIKAKTPLSGGSRTESLAQYRQLLQAPRYGDTRCLGNVGERQRHSSGHEGGEPVEKILASSLVVRGLRELLVKPLFPKSLVVGIKRAVVLPEPGECLHLHGRVGLRPGVELACLDRAEQCSARSRHA